MASSSSDPGMWECSAGELRNFERLLGRRFSASDIRSADDETICAAHKAFRKLLDERRRQAPKSTVRLGKGEYLVHVDCYMPFDEARLESDFSTDGVSEIFYDEHEWQFHSSCVSIGQVPCDCIMLLKRFSRVTTSEANITEMAKLGYRPATHLEAYVFAKAYPDLQRRFWIVALGSSKLYGGSRNVAVLGGDSDGRVLGNNDFDRKWDPSDRFLFVRK